MRLKYAVGPAQQAVGEANLLYFTLRWGFSVGIENWSAVDRPQVSVAAERDLLWIPGVGARICRQSEQGFAIGFANRNVGEIGIFETEDVDAVVVRRSTLAMERIDTTDLAEEMPRGAGKELILAERFLSLQQVEVIFVHFNHERVLLATDAAIAGCQLRKVRFYAKHHSATMAAALISFFLPCAHLLIPVNLT
jgi:hypothetical protein